MPVWAEASLPPTAVASRTLGIGLAVRASEERGPDEEQDGSSDEQESGLLGAMGDGCQPEQQADSAAPGADFGAVRRVHGRKGPRPEYSGFDDSEVKFMLRIVGPPP